MVKWSLLRDRIKRVLGDTTFTDADLADYVNQALVAISSHTAHQKVYGQVLATDTSAIELPDDILEIGPVHVKNGVVENNIYIPTRLAPGQSLPAIPIGDMRTHYYYRWGNTVNFLTPILGGRLLEIFYFAYWDRVDEDTDLIRVMRWMEEPLQWYAMHLAMAKPGSSAARLRTWNTKQDSGNPVDNSPVKFAEFCLKRYQSLLNDAPSQDREGWDARDS
jgi:hypothetical protein